jgi:hypothetical protein
MQISLYRVSRPCSAMGFDFTERCVKVHAARGPGRPSLLYGFPFPSLLPLGLPPRTLHWFAASKSDRCAAEQIGFVRRPSHR